MIPFGRLVILAIFDFDSKPKTPFGLKWVRKFFDQKST
jgi:hypothetical protein